MTPKYSDIIKYAGIQAKAEAVYLPKHKTEPQ